MRLKRPIGCKNPRLHKGGAYFRVIVLDCISRTSVANKLVSPCEPLCGNDKSSVSWQSNFRPALHFHAVRLSLRASATVKIGQNKLWCPLISGQVAQYSLYAAGKH